LSTQTATLDTQNHWLADGVQTIWNFSFADGYLARDFVKAYTRSPAGVRTELTINDASFVGEFQLSIVPAVPDGHTLVIYRSTQKDAPLVDFADGAHITEASLDTVARQGVHLAAETADFFGVTTEEDLVALGQAASASAAAAAASAGTAAAQASAAAASATTATTQATSSGTSATASALSAANAASAATAAVNALKADMADPSSASNGDALIGWGAITSISSGTLTRHASISAAVAAIGSAVAKLTIRGPASITSLQLIPANITLECLPGALITVSPGVVVVIYTPIVAGDYRIFSTTGNIIVAGANNPLWWGAVASRTDPGPTVAAANTMAFRCAAKSFWSDYTINAGQMGSPGYCVPFFVQIPSGVFFLSNGFTAAVGVHVFGDSDSGTALVRLTSNQDTDTQRPLLTVGQSYDVAPGLAYKNDPTSTLTSISPTTAAGYPQTLAAARQIYFVDQHPSAGAFHPDFPGCQFSSLFFTSCGLGILFTDTGDVTGTNVIIDMGLTALAFSNCQNVALSNIYMYNVKSQAIAVGSGTKDVTISNFMITYPEGMGVYFSEGATSIDNFRMSDGLFMMNIQYPSFSGAIRSRATGVKAHFNNINFRNLRGEAVVNDLVTTGCEFDFEDCTFDGLKTVVGYNQSTTMKMITAISGRWSFKNCKAQNLFGASGLGFTPDFRIDGLQYSNITGGWLFTTAAATGGTFYAKGVTGDGTAALVLNVGSGMKISVKGSTQWLGAPAAYAGTHYVWLVPLQNYCQISATVSAQPDGTAGVRKSATYVWEKSVEALPALTDTLTGVKIWASPVANGHAEIAPVLHFLNDTAAQAAAGATTARLKIPIAYSNGEANIEFLS
jgi:hypothetical protein